MEIDAGTGWGRYRITDRSYIEPPSAPFYPTSPTARHAPWQHACRTSGAGLPGNLADVPAHAFGEIDLGCRRVLIRLVGALRALFLRRQPGAAPVLAQYCAQGRAHEVQGLGYENALSLECLIHGCAVFRW